MSTRKPLTTSISMMYASIRRDFVYQSPNQNPPQEADLLFGGLPPPIPRKGEMHMGKDIRIAVRVTAKEKDKIQSKARKCRLSTTEYVKQRALGYEPRGIPPDALFLCLEKLSELADKASSPEQAFEIGKATARRMWCDKYQVLVTVHLNTDNVHCHFVVNPVSFKDGTKFQNKIGDHKELRRGRDDRT